MANDPFSFSGEDAFNYETYLGPLLFEPASREIIRHIPISASKSVLELACGTGRLTKLLRQQLPASSRLVATDISTDMIDLAKKQIDLSGIEFITADAQQLPFPDSSFDLVICQFGFMFLPDRPKGFQEAFRVLKPGGSLVFATWDSSMHIPLVRAIIEDTIIPFFGHEQPERFRIPFSMNDPENIQMMVKQSGFQKSSLTQLHFKAGASSPENVVNAFLLKHPLGRAVANKNPIALEALGAALLQRIRSEFGNERIDADLCAFLVTAGKI